MAIDTLPLFTGIGAHIGDRLARRDYLFHLHQASKQRVNIITKVVAGEWYTVWPNLTQTPEAPTVANIIEMGINHWAAVLGAVLPTLSSPVYASEDASQGKRGARKRERRLRELWRRSNWSELAAKNGADYSGSGFTILGVWVNFGESDLKKRHPYVVHYDPRHTYILKDELGDITEMLVSRRVDEMTLAAQIKEEYPVLYERMKDHINDVEEWFWYDKETFFRAIIDVSKEGREAGRWVVLVNEPNELGFVPAYETVRPTFDGERRGIFDQTIHILRTMHRLMLLTIASTEENSFPAIAVFDVQNPQDFGPGAIIRMRSPESSVERLGPSNHFDVKDLISRLSDDARAQSTYPQQLMGEPGASIVSAKGIGAAQGALDARLALAHRQFEVLYSKVSGFLMAMDQVYCDGEKTILGDASDNIAAESWLPSRDIAGAWVVEATYGIGAGSDPANIEIRLNMNVESGMISLETGRANLPFLPDPGGEPIKIFREQMRAAISAAALARAEKTGDITLAAKALQLVSKDDVDFEEAMMELVEIMTAPQEGEGEAGPAGPESPALEALQTGESLARGGGPNAAGGTLPGGGLPPLSRILGQDSRQVS